MAWKIQELKFGGLSEPAKARLDQLISQIDLPLGDPGPARPRPAKRNGHQAPLIGTTLVRRWHDQDLRVVEFCFADTGADVESICLGTERAGATTHVI